MCLLTQSCPKKKKESSPTPQFKSINSLALSVLYGSTLTPMHDYWKNHSFDYMDLCQQSDVSAFLYAVYDQQVGHSFSLREQASFDFRAAVIICSDFGAQENKVCHCFHCFPIYLSWGDGTGCHDLIFWMLSFKAAFSLSSFTLIKRLFSSSLLSAFIIWGCLYFSWQSQFQLVSQSASILQMYSAYKLNKQGDNIQSSHTPFQL